MKVTELGDCSIVVENDKDESMDIMFNENKKQDVAVVNISREYDGIHKVSDYIYTAKTLVLYFKEMPGDINVGDRVALVTGGMVYL